MFSDFARKNTDTVHLQRHCHQSNQEPGLSQKVETDWVATFYVKESYFDDIRIEHIDGRNNWHTCLRNPLNLFDLKYCTLKLLSLLGSNEVTCAMSVVWQCFEGSDKSKTLHTRYMGVGVLCVYLLHRLDYALLWCCWFCTLQEE